MSEQCNDILRELESWYRTEKGQYVLAQTREVLKPYLETAFGYHILQIGPARGLPLHHASMINHRIYASHGGGKGVDLICNDGEIPLQNDSVDVVIAHHCLEFTANSHQVLREIQRILTPQGHMVLVGFNPYSVHGIMAKLRGISTKSLWHWHAPVGEPRLRDWLNLLGCELHTTRYVYAPPTLGMARFTDVLRRCGQWFTRKHVPFGGLYLMHAVKHVPAKNKPHRLLRRRSWRLFGLTQPKPSRVASAGAPQHDGTTQARTAATAAANINNDSGEHNF